MIYRIEHTYLGKKFKNMISVTSVTDNYILQPTLLNKHKKTLEWLSTAVLWKSEKHEQKYKRKTKPYGWGNGPGK